MGRRALRAQVRTPRGRRRLLRRLWRHPLVRRAALVLVALWVLGAAAVGTWAAVTRRRPAGPDVVRRMWHRECAPGGTGEPELLAVADLEPEATDPASAPVPVVLLHGLGMSSRSLARLVSRLGAHTRALAPDLPGYGRSPQPRAGLLGVDELARAVLAWMDEAGVDDAVLVGHSLGAQVAGEVALLAPDRVRRLVVVGPTGDPERGSVLAQALRLLRDVRREPLSVVAVAVADYLQAGPWQMVTLMGRAMQRAQEQLHVTVDVPLLVVRGEHDPVCRQDWCEQVVAATPGARLVVVPDAAHGIACTAPPELVDLLVREVRRAGRTAPRG